jgi:hypothetical protein
MLAIANFADLEGKCFPSVRTIAEWSECCLRTARNRLRALEGLGHIAVAERPARKDGGKTSNEITILGMADWLAATKSATPTAKSAGGSKRKGGRQDLPGEGRQDLPMPPVQDLPTPPANTLPGKEPLLNLHSNDIPQTPKGAINDCVASLNQAKATLQLASDWMPDGVSFADGVFTVVGKERASMLIDFDGDEKALDLAIKLAASKINHGSRQSPVVVLRRVVQAKALERHERAANYAKSVASNATKPKWSAPKPEDRIVRDAAGNAIGYRNF